MIKHFLFEAKNQEKSAYIWNTSSAMLSSFQTVFILMVISRIDPIKDAGIFTIAFAIGNLMMTIGKYGMRQFQISDVENKYSFSTYVATRVFSIILMVIICTGYLGYYLITGEYSLEKTMVIMLICFTKVVDSGEDVCHGEFQKKGRLDVAGKILTFRLGIYILVYIITYICWKDLTVASVVSFLCSFIVCIIFNKTALKILLGKKKKTNKQQGIELLKECFPLVISAFLIMYIGNAPKYALDTVMSSQEQACFGYVFMPVFVISLLSQFVYQPVIYQLANLRRCGALKKLKNEIMKQIYIIIALTCLTTIGGKLLGIQVLSIIYGVDLQGYDNILLLLLMGGGILSCVNFFQVIITIFRKQAILAKGYAVAFLLFIIGGKSVVRNYGMLGISIFYVMVIAILMAIFGYQIIRCFRCEEI